MTSRPEPDRAEQYVGWVLRHRIGVMAVALLLALVAGYQTLRTYAALRSDLEELLPETAPSVTALASVRERLPGLRNLGVVVDTGGQQHVEAASRFLDDLKARISAYPPGFVESVTVDVKAERKFLETYLLQLIDPADVRRIRELVEQHRDEAVTEALDLDLGDEDERGSRELSKELATTIDELKTKYEKRFGAAQAFPNDRLVSPDGKTAVLLIRASSHRTDATSDSELLNRVKQSIAELGFPESYAKELRVGFASDVATRVEELHGLVSDLSLSGVLVTSLIISVLYAYFRSLKSILILGLPLALGTLYAFGLVALPPLSIRYLNSNTAFLGSIIIGNGVNSGIILLARFREEHKPERPVHSALAAAVEATWRPTLAAALAAAIAYGSLVITDFRGFSQFGWIGGIGMVVCWLATFTVGPIAIFWLGGSVRPANNTARGARLRHVASQLLAHPRVVVLVALALGIGSLAAIQSRTDDWLEQDFLKLRRRDSWVSGERYWGQRQDRTLQRYLTPTVVMTDSPETARAMEADVQELKREGRAGALIATVRSLHTLLRPERSASIAEAKELRDVLTPRLKAELEDKERKLIESALSDASLVELTAKDLPASLTIGLEEYGGRSDRNVLVFPALGAGTWDVARMVAYTDDLRGAAAHYDPPPPIAGQLLLSSDIARAVREDGPRASAIALAVVLVITVLTFRSSVLALTALTSLIVGVLVMLGLLAAAGQRINFCNFVTLPITFGIAADYSINMLKRFQSTDDGALADALIRTGGAVSMCSLTTIIGFGSLLVAQNQALFSFGLFAVTGELTCLATAVLGLPAALELVRRRRKP